MLWCTLPERTATRPLARRSLSRRSATVVTEEGNYFLFEGRQFLALYVKNVNILPHESDRWRLQPAIIIKSSLLLSFKKEDSSFLKNEAKDF
jgi:hypothetical protein